MGNRVLKLMVVMLSTINALVWWLYTASPFMALAWAGIAVGFVYWITDDVRREWSPRKYRPERRRRPTFPGIRMGMMTVTQTQM